MALGRKRGYYSQFEELSPEEVSAQLRAAAEERKAKALERVEPLDLRSLTWPELPPSRVVNAITYAARRGLHRELDPTSGELRSELAHAHGLPDGRVAVGQGASGLLAAAAQALLEPGDELLMPWPSWHLLPAIARRARAEPVAVPGFGIDTVLGHVTGATRLVVLCNPNDPTGELLGTDDLRALLERLPERVVVVVDEALRDFAVGEELDATVGLLEDHPRLLLVRTFSKAWGLAGLRCGYALGGPGAEPLLELLRPWLGLDELARAGALEAVRTVGPVVERRVTQIARRREWLLGEARELGLHAPHSHANLLWLRADGLEGAELARRLGNHAVLVAPGGPLGDPSHVRVTVPHDDALGERLLQALRRALSPTA
jgi:histidinol-phosphate aminotransferase